MIRDARWLASSLLLAAFAVAAFPGPAAAQDLPGVLVSRQLLDSRGLRVGDVLRLSTDRSGGHVREFRIQGTYEPAPDPMRFAQQRLEVRLHLPDLQELLASSQRGVARSAPIDPESVTSINVALKNPGDAADFARDLTGRLPGIVARPTTAPNERTSTFVVLEQFHLAIAIVTVIGSAVFLLALMVMLVDERRSTVGILRLIGFTRHRILLQVFAEGALIAIAGAACGILLALASQGMFNRFFQWRYDTTLVFLRITPAVVGQSLLLAIPLGIMASLIASWSLLRQQLLSLLRR